MEIYGTARQATEENTKRCMRFAFWINKALDTHSESIIVVAFSLQQWLHNPPQYYIYTCISFPVCVNFSFYCTLQHVQNFIRIIEHNFNMDMLNFYFVIIIIISDWTNFRITQTTPEQRTNKGRN